MGAHCEAPPCPNSRPSDMPPISDVVLAQIDLTTLAQLCSAESQRFYKRQPYDTRFAYELFRRALVDRNEAAWAQIYSLYYGLVDLWVRRSSSFAQSGESSEFFVTAAFTRFWRAMTPERFPAFPTLATLLQYLQLCTNSTVVDMVRGHSWAEMMPEEAMLGERRSACTPDEEALERVSRAEFWRYVGAMLRSEAERVVVFGIYVVGFKPSDIYVRRRDLFATVQQVYAVKRNVLSRLGRSPELQLMATG